MFRVALYSLVAYVTESKYPIGKPAAEPVWVECTSFEKHKQTLIEWLHEIN